MSTTDLPRLADLLATTNEARFITLNPHPYFVLINHNLDETDDGYEFYTSTSSTYSEDESDEIIAGKRLDHNARLIELSKRPGANPFSALITIGRADNCDIVLPSKSISKFHAYLASIPQLDDTFEYQLADSSSRNGTSVNDQRLAPKELVALSNGDRIDFGGVLFVRFFTPKGLWQELQKLRAH